MNNATIESMHKLGVTESYKLKRQVIVSASEAAEMILRYVNTTPRTPSFLTVACSVDTILRAAPRKREAH